MRDIAALPKAHLHVHLESTVRWATVRELADAHGIAVPERQPAVFAGFRQFADHNSLVRSCLRTPEDFVRIAREFSEDEAAQGTRYAEVTFTAVSHGERLGDLGMPLEAVVQGLAQGPVECRLILDHPRRRSVNRFERTLRLAQRHPEVVAIGVAGEEAHPLEPFTEVFDAAKDAGLGLVHHAGESCGAPSVRDVIKLGRADRIGHGFRVLEDPDLVAEVRDRGIPLEVCPASNVALGLVESLSSHPLPRLRDAGLVVTLNTDIPSTTGTTLTDEYTRVRDTFGYDDTVLAEFARAAIDASFAPKATKARLHRDTSTWLTG